MVRNPVHRRFRGEEPLEDPRWALKMVGIPCDLVRRPCYKQSRMKGLLNHGAFQQVRACKLVVPLSIPAKSLSAFSSEDVGIVSHLATCCTPRDQSWRVVAHITII